MNTGLIINFSVAAVHGFEASSLNLTESETPYTRVFRANVKGTAATQLITQLSVKGVEGTASKLLFIV